MADEETITIRIPKGRAQTLRAILTRTRQRLEREPIDTIREGMKPTVSFINDILVQLYEAQND